MSIKSALRDWLSMSYGMISILVVSRYAAPPYPAAPDFPPFGGQNKTPRITLFINGSTVSTGYSATACGGKVVAPATKGGMHFQRLQGGCMFFLRAIAPSNFRTFKPHRGLVHKAQAPSGIPESTAPIPIPTAPQAPSAPNSANSPSPCRYTWPR